MIQRPRFVDGEEPFREYPRPQMRRNSYFSLNGEWDYAITKTRKEPGEYDGKILVPYPPESEASGVKRVVGARDYLHYRRTFTLPEGFVRGRVLLNVGACDQVCEVIVNGVTVGKHEGGYLPFTLDITDALERGENELRFIVTDDAASPIYGRGKQSYEPGGIWYSSVSGIWQTVWLESVPHAYITELRLTPDLENRKLRVRYRTVGNGRVTARIWENGNKLAEGSGSLGEIVLDASACKPWSPEDPQLYFVELAFGADSVIGYFGMREFGRTTVAGRSYFTLNGRPVFHNGLLDQGYWKEGLYTPPSNRAMYEELARVKDLGFNMLRKHLKVEPALWYYYCDTLGLLVWQDMVNGGGKYSKFRINVCPFVDLHIDDTNYRKMGRDDPRSREQYMAEAYGTIDALRSFVGICVWTPFNEAWGQFDAPAVCRRLRSADPTRLFDHASGWQDKGAGDVYSRHVYFRKVKLKNDGRRVLALTEFGGYTYAMPGHTFTSRPFGYRRMKSSAELTAELSRLYREEIVPLIYDAGLCATVYTQLTDIEDEVNGLFTYDRVLKADPDVIRAFNTAVYDAFALALRSAKASE